MKKMTTVLLVEQIEPCLDFWVRRLGFTKTVEVPDEDRLGFVILVNGAVEVMLQTYRSVAKDAPGSAAPAPSVTNLYAEVENLEQVIAKLDGLPVILPRRQAFYGADEIGVREPGGHHVVFAQFG